MKKLLLIAFFFWFCTSVLFPQANSMPESTTAHIDSLKGLLPTTPDGPDKFKLLGSISWEHINLSQYSMALQYADSIHLAAKKLRDEEGLAYSQIYYGVVSRHKGDYTNALEHLRNFIDFNVTIGDSSRVAAGLFQLSAVYTNTGDYPKALAANYRLMAIHEKNDYQHGIAFTSNGTGAIYRRMKKHDEAIGAYHKAISIYDGLDAPRDKADALSNLANVQVDLGRYDEAFRLYHEALEIDRSIGYEGGIAYDLENIGVLFNETGQYDSALTYQLKALDIRKNLSGRYEIGVCLKQTGLTYLSLKQNEQAQEYLEKGLEIALELGSKPLLLEIYKWLASVHANKNKFPKALSLKNEEIQEANFKQQLSELEMKALQAQINPHFIFNCINSINKTILEGNSEDASRYLTKFSRLIRLILENAERPGNPDCIGKEKPPSFVYY